MKNNFDFKDLKTLNKETKFLCVRNFLNYYVKIIILIVLALLLLNLLLKQNKSIEFLQPIITNDNFYMSVFTLLGALVGGFCTIVGAKMSFNSDIKAKASLKRADKIYTLLYDELIYNHNMLIDCTMDDLLVHSKNDGRDDYYDRLVYSELGKICNDSRSLEIPKKFKKQIDSFYNSIEEFSDSIKISDKAIKEFFYELGDYDNQKILGKHGIISHIILGGFEGEALELKLKNTDVSIRDFCKLISSDVLNLEEIVKLREIYSNLINIEKNLIRSLEYEIKYINFKYKK